MIHAKSWFVVAAAILVWGGAALAQVDAPPGGRLPPGNDASLRDTPSIPDTAPLVPGAKDPAGRSLGEHQVTGRVQSLDKQSGTVSIDVKGKDVQILFPPSALQNLEEGNEVTLLLSLRKAPDTAGQQ